MVKGKWLVVLVVVSLLTVAIVGVLLLQDEEDHLIDINGDHELREVADRNDWEGNGSPEAPFVITTSIEGEGDRPCISLANTTLHITIKGCQLTHEATGQGEAQGIGLLLDNVTNVSIINNSASGGLAGLVATSSSNVTLKNNTFAGMGPNLITTMMDSDLENNIFTATEGSGLEMSYCEGNSFSYNSFDGNVLGAGGTRGWVGLVMSRSANNTFFADQMNGGGYMGIGMSLIDSNDNRYDEALFNGRIGVYMNRACGNNISSSTFGENVATAIEMVESDDNGFIDNTMMGNYTTTGIKMTSCTENLFERNSVGVHSISGYTVYANGSDGNELFGNNFYYLGTEVRSFALAFDDTGTNDWNETEGGNHWSDWITPDDDADGIVDHPYLIDGPAEAMDNLPMTVPIIN